MKNLYFWPIVIVIWIAAGWFGSYCHRFGRHAPKTVEILTYPCGSDVGVKTNAHYGSRNYMVMYRYADQHGHFGVGCQQWYHYPDEALPQSFIEEARSRIACDLIAKEWMDDSGKVTITETIRLGKLE